MDFKSVENTMKGGDLILLAILGLATPLFATNEDPETMEIKRMNEGLDFDDYEDSDDRLDEDPDEDFDEMELDRMSRSRMSRRKFMQAARREWRQMMNKMQESKMSLGQMKEKRREFVIGKRYEWHMMKANEYKKMMKPMGS